MKPYETVFREPPSFLSVAVRAMQQILVDHYRPRRRETRVDMHEGNPFEVAIDNLERETGFDFEALSLAIDELKQSSSRQHAVVVHRFFGGLRVEDTAELLNVSIGTVERDWRLVRAKLMRRLRH